MSCHHAPSFSSNPSLEKGPSSPFLFSQDTARKTIFSFSRRPEKIVFPKKMTQEYDLSCIIGKDDISFSRKCDFTPCTENEWWSFSKKIHENVAFSSDVLKRWSFRKDCAGIRSFLYYLKKLYFFLRKRDIFSFGRKMKDDFSQEIHGNMIFSVYTCRCYKRDITSICQKQKKSKINEWYPRLTF